MEEDMESIIYEIMQQYPEEEWLNQCRAAMPDASDGEILSAIEIFSGGDIHVIDT
jgi:hypothetical protein